MFFANIFSMAASFRTMSFPPREAMTTAEPPEPLPLQLLAFCFQLFALRSSRPGGEAMFVSISVHSWFYINHLIVL